MFHTIMIGGQMKKLIILNVALLGLATVFITPVVIMAGDLVPLYDYNDSRSAMFSMDAIWNRLEAGDGGQKRKGTGPDLPDSFVEPSSGPANGVGKTLNDIMLAAPKADNDKAATLAEVAPGKTYWSLRSDRTWGLQSSPWAPVPKSGQTTCYPVNGVGTVPCQGTGQDGDTLKGVALTDLPDRSRFTDNLNGTVTDNLTGLVWLQDANCDTNNPTGVTWATALTEVATLASGACGLSDGSEDGAWRLPNIRELMSLVNDQYAAPALSNTAGVEHWTAGAPFTGVKFDVLDTYWSSTTYAGDATKACIVNLADGSVKCSDDNKTTTTHYVWPVRDK